MIITMLKCASIFTFEIDDPEAAFLEIKSQLDDKIELLDNTIGIIMCHPEFIDSGVTKYICDQLPFELAGITTSAQAVDGEAGELILAIFVMTSDDVWFKAGVTEGLDDGIEGPVRAAFERALGETTGDPRLAILFPPFILKYSGDSYVDAVRKIIPSVPVFGPIAIDDTLIFNLAKTIYNGESFRTEMPFILCYGNISPRFIVGTFPEDTVMPYKGEITKSSGSIVHEINNITAYEYFNSIGFVTDGVLTESFHLVPFAIDQKKRDDYDGIPVVRGIVYFEKDGSAVFRGDIDEGSTFTLLTFEANEVLKATREKIEQLNGLPDVNGALLFPCIARRMMTMRENPLKELETVKDTINPGIPFMIGYAGGEICPTLIKGGAPTNRYHNYSLIILAV